MSILHALNSPGRRARKPPGRSRGLGEKRIEAGFAEAIEAHVIGAAREQGVRLRQVNCRVQLGASDDSAPRRLDVVVVAAGPTPEAELTAWLSGTVRDTPALRVVDTACLDIRVELREAVAPLRGPSSKRARRWRPKNV